MTKRKAVEPTTAIVLYQEPTDTAYRPIHYGYAYAAVDSAKSALPHPDRINCASVAIRKGKPTLRLTHRGGDVKYHLISALDFEGLQEWALLSFAG